jgi:hypothetical protein
MFVIGIIDDVQNERDDIQVSILDNLSDVLDVSFKEYLIEGRSKEELLYEIRTDIIKDKINLLVVDFKLDTKEKIISGSEIIEFMHEETPDFPVVILTNAPDESKNSESTDADKIYAKKTFLNPELRETKEQVHNMQLHMEKYIKHRRELEAKLNIAINKYHNVKDVDSVTAEIVEIENKLSRYKQIYQSAVEKNIDIKNLESAFDILNKLKAMEEDENEKNSV